MHTHTLRTHAHAYINIRTLIRMHAHTHAYSITRMHASYVAEYKITGGHWLFSVHLSKMADKNIQQDTFKYTNGQLNIKQT